jgi:sugar phosphate isomerase/epimerase
MYFTGFADEAADGIEGQIRATKELGWRNIESRNIDGKNIHDISDEAFDNVCAALQEAGVGINCFGSAVANWGKQITEPMDSSLEEAKRAIPRMQRLGTRLIRIMSYAVLPDREPDDQMEEERFSRLCELTALFLDNGIQPVHENCMNYGGLGWTYTQKLLEQVPGLKLVFDTGNPVFTDDRTKEKPYPKQSAWEFYTHVKDYIAYIHIKDGIMVPDPETGGTKCKYTWPGEGDGDVKRIVKDLITGGYDGGISIEPHLGAVFHDPSVTSDEESRYATYVEYGRRMEALVKDL